MALAQASQESVSSGAFSLRLYVRRCCQPLLRKPYFFQEIPHWQTFFPWLEELVRGISNPPKMDQYLRLFGGVHRQADALTGFLNLLAKAVSDNEVMIEPPSPKYRF